MLKEFIMKKITYTLMFLFVSLGFSQNNPINFESEGYGAAWTWTVFENDTNPPLEIVANPDSSGINTSTTVSKFTALQEGTPFAGVESMHGSDIGTFTLDASNTLIKIMVWKSVISDVGIKFVDAAGAAQEEIKVSNTLINQWEELTFDFSSRIGAFPIVKDQIVIFPDFDARSADTIIYFDTITFSSSVLGVSEIVKPSVVAYPNPVTNMWNVKAEESIVEIIIYNLLGQKILKVTPNTDNISVDLVQFDSGIYLAIVKTDYGIKTIKLIKE